jgi:hypothetical protein
VYHQIAHMTRGAYIFYDIRLITSKVCLFLEAILCSIKVV